MNPSATCDTIFTGDSSGCATARWLKGYGILVMQRTDGLDEHEKFKELCALAQANSLDATERVELVHKSVGYRDITDFFVERLKTEFVAVSKPLYLNNSNGSLLFILFFAAGNDRSAKTGLKIANSIIGN